MTYIPGSGSGSGNVSTSSDVALDNVANSDVLAYNGSLAKWTNASIMMISVLTQAEYDALSVKDPNTLYMIVG